MAGVLPPVSAIATPPAPAAQNLGVGLRRPCRGQTCGGMLGEMARIVSFAARQPSINRIFSFVGFCEKPTEDIPYFERSNLAINLRLDKREFPKPIFFALD